MGTEILYASVTVTVHNKLSLLQLIMIMISMASPDDAGNTQCLVADDCLGMSLPSSLHQRGRLVDWECYWYHPGMVIIC